MTFYRNEDLVLAVRPDYDPSVLRLDAYEGFLDALCEDREYQKDAIRRTCIFLAGGEYLSTADLARENYSRSSVLRERYRSAAQLVSALPFADALATSVDLATGTGKSWVMYGIGRILLAEGLVDRVLVLCPSRTIESSLRAKFRRFSADPRLLELIPADREFRVPEITDANVTTGPGCMCVENIDATYEHVNSSVRDSFAGVGSKTLVLNDEAHHIYSPIAPGASIKKWKSFLEDPLYGFRFIVGFSGTCYVGNDYMADVTSRYSLSKAMEDGRVKQVHYVQKDASLNEDERFQKYLQLHQENKRKYSTIKPLSIIVTSKITAAEVLASQFRSFLQREQRISAEAAESQVLLVTSKPGHRDAVARLATVDGPLNPAEWIISVSMLTEGWDVQNVFQVIPHEKRAFDSKLLIAQVLGRGLRVPIGSSGPVLKVFNHAAWSSEISNLVKEVLDEDRRIRSVPVSSGAHSNHHFSLHNIQYEAETRTTDLATREENGAVNLFTRGYVQLETQVSDLERHTLFVSALGGGESTLRTKVHFQEYTVNDVVQNMHGKLKAVDLELGTSYSRDYPRTLLTKVVDQSLERIGESRGVVSEPNLQRLLRAMGNIRREVARTVRIQLKPMQIQMVSTRDLPTRSLALSSFLKEATVFFDSESLDVGGDDGERMALDELTDEDSAYPKRATRRVANKFNFKSPTNVVFTTHEPERSFVGRLMNPDVAGKIQSWIKSSDTGFYEISYSWRRGDHTKQGRFNPDLFVVLDGSTDILVIELKEDLDESDENRAKLRYAIEHFARVNETQSEAVYHMKFISPSSYDAFFDSLKAGAGASFVSAIHASLVD